MVLLSAGYKAQSQPGFGNIGFNTFYTELSPYGQWINNADYGQVWVSNENGFEPYSNNGHWDFTSYGWMWVSDYSWGWAPFHYGRWAYLPAYGWAWVPGYEWAPAWVSHEEAPKHRLWICSLAMRELRRDFSQPCCA